MSMAVTAVTPVLLLAALVLGALALVRTRQIGVALPVFLDLLLAVGLLHLGTSGSWQTISGAAVLIVVRKLATYSIARAAGARRRVSLAGPAPSP